MAGTRKFLAFLFVFLIFSARADSSPPLFDFIQPATEILGDNVQVKIRVVDESGIDLDSLSLWLDGQSVAFDWVENCYMVSTLFGLAEGWYQLTVSARDRKGNSGMAFRRFHVRMPKREIRLLTDNLLKKKGKMDVSLLLHNFTHENWKERMSLRLNGTVREFSIEIPPRQTSVIQLEISADLPPGFHQLKVYGETGEELGVFVVRVLEEKRNYITYLLPLPLIFPVIIWLRRRKRTTEEAVAV